MRSVAQLRNLSKALLDACQKGSLSAAQRTAPLLYPTAKSASLFGTVPLRTAVAEAARHGKADVLKYMLTLPASKASKEPWNPEVDDALLQENEYKFGDVWGGTVAMAASGSGSLQVMKTLMEAGMPVNVVMENMGTPIHVAVYRQDVPMIKFLLENRANPNTYSEFPGNSLLADATGFESTEIMELLLEHGAKVRDHSSMRSAAENGNIAALKLLLGRGADIDEHYYPWGADDLDSFGTALHAAVTGCQAETVKFLLDNGADMNVKDFEGTTPKDIASSGEDRKDILGLLDEAEATRQKQ